MPRLQTRIDTGDNMRQPQPALTDHHAPSLKAAIYYRSLSLLSHFVPPPPTPTEEDQETHGEEEVRDS